MNTSRKEKEINRSRIPKEKRGQKKSQRTTERGYEKVEYSLVFKRERYNGKEDLRKSKILINSQ